MSALRVGTGRGQRRQGDIRGADHYVILEAEGRGHNVGCLMDMDCFEHQKYDWHGEADDMIVVDGEPWPPRPHGTEDHFNTVSCPTRSAAPLAYRGLTVYSGTPDWPWGGKNSIDCFHIEGPDYLERSIRASIEHGHANNLAHDYSSTSHGYQAEPHRPIGPLPPAAERLPRL